MFVDVFSRCVGERNTLQTVFFFVLIFSVFIFLMPSKVIIVIEFMFLGMNIFWALLRAHFKPRLTPRAKMSLSRRQNIIMPANINSIVLITGRATIWKNLKLYSLGGVRLA